MLRYVYIACLVRFPLQTFVFTQLMQEVCKFSESLESFLIY